MAALRRRLLIAAAGSSHQAPPFSVIDLTSARLPRRPCAEPLCSVSNRPGANVKAVQAMRGHASAAMTLDIYADLFDDDLEAVAVRWMRPLPGDCGQSVATGSYRPPVAGSEHDADLQ